MRLAGNWVLYMNRDKLSRADNYTLGTVPAGVWALKYHDT